MSKNNLILCTLWFNIGTKIYSKLYFLCNSNPKLVYGHPLVKDQDKTKISSLKIYNHIVLI